MQNKRQSSHFVAPVNQSSSIGTNYEEVCIGDKKVFRCTIPDCGKTFKFKSEMKRHQTIHSGERPYVCSFPDCGKTFKRADALSNHFRIHSGKTPFDCPMSGCSLQFNTKSALRYHLLKHKGEKSFKCSHPGCGKAFLTFTQLKQHEKASYYHQKVDSATSQPDQSVTTQMQAYSSDETCSIPSRETPRYDNSEYNYEPQFTSFDFNEVNVLKYEEIDPSYYEQSMNTYSCIKRAYSHLDEKPEETTAGTPELSAISYYSKINPVSTMMSMPDTTGMSFMMEDAFPVQKKLKCANSYLQCNFNEKRNVKEEVDVDSFFKKKSEFEAEEGKETNFGTLFFLINQTF